MKVELLTSVGALAIRRDVAKNARSKFDANPERTMKQDLAPLAS